VFEDIKVLSRIRKLNKGQTTIYKTQLLAV